MSQRRRGKGTKLTAGQVAEARRRHDAGETPAEIAPEYRISPITLARHLRVLAPMRSPSEARRLRTVRDPRNAEMRRLYVEEGWTMPRIAAHFDCCYATVYQRLQAMQVPTRPRSARRR